MQKVKNKGDLKKMSKEVIPVSFKEKNTTYISPKCGDLPVFRGEGQVVSCWRVPFIKRLKMFFTGRIWLVLRSENQPPCYVEIDKPLAKNKEKDE